MSQDIRNNWTLEEIRDIYHSPVLQLIVRGAEVHKQYQTTGEVQVCTLLSVKRAAAAKTALTARKLRATTLA